MAVLHFSTRMDYQQPCAIARFYRAQGDQGGRKMEVEQAGLHGWRGFKPARQR
jgi:hypothetical protein